MNYAAGALFMRTVSKAAMFTTVLDNHLLGDL